MNPWYCFLKFSNGEFQGWIDYAMLFTLETTPNAGGLQILRCQGFEVKYDDVTLDALTLKPSDVCNVKAKSSNDG
jgi:hypothetical protein